MAGKKYDQEKPPLQLIPPIAQTEEAKVMGFGSKKYGAYNWMGGMEWSRLVGAAQRHILAWHGGEDLDPESGVSHLAHARCCLAMLMGYQDLSIGTDDRYGSVNKPTSQES